MKKRQLLNFTTLVLVLGVMISCNSGLTQSKLTKVSGRQLYVSIKTGNDQANGLSAEKAFKTLPYALSKLQEGDALNIMPGEYYFSPLTIKDLPCSKGKPIVIRATPRGKAIISGAWKEAATGKVKWDKLNDGLWSAKHANPLLFAGWNGRFLYRYMNIEDLKKAKILLKRGWNKGKTRNGTKYGFVWKDGTVYLKLPDGADPNGKRIIFSTPFWGEKGVSPVINVINSPGLIFDGLRIQASGVFGIKFWPASTHAIVRNCIFEYCRSGISLPSYSLVEWCEHTYPGFNQFSEELRQLNDGKIVTYNFVKDYQPHNWYESGIADYAYGMKTPPVKCEFRYNFMHELFDGENLGGFNDSESHHNVYLNCYDNCVEMEGWQKGFGSENLRFHHNLLLSCPSAPISHQNPEDLKGPHYVYNNVVVGYNDHGWNPWTLIKSKCYQKGRGFYYYNNLFYMHSCDELFWNEKDWPQEWLKTFVFKNNIFAFEKKLGRQTGPKGSDNFFTAANNIVATPKVDKKFLKSLLRNNGKYLTSPKLIKFRNPDKLDFTLLPGSPAIDAGIKIPGFTDGFKGNAPDIGPFEFGEKIGKQWPRPRHSVFNITPPERLTGQIQAPQLIPFKKGYNKNDQ